VRARDASEVRRLLTESLWPGEARATPIRIEERGATYRIAVRGTATTLEDHAHDCAERAREAAVIAASDMPSRPQLFGPPVWTI